MPLSEPSRMRIRRRNEEMLRSGCIRPETTGRDRDNKIAGSCVVILANCITVQCTTQVLRWFLTLFRVCVCPIRIRALEEMMERQKFMRITERSDRMYLEENSRKQIKKTLSYSQDHILHMTDPSTD